MALAQRADHGARLHDDGFDLERIADHDRALRAPQSTHYRLWGGLSGLINEQPADAFSTQAAKVGRERRERRGDDGNAEEEKAPHEGSITGCGFRVRSAE